MPRGLTRCFASVEWICTSFLPARRPARITAQSCNCHRGGIGRRAWFRSMYPQGCGGSSPFDGTIKHQRLFPARGSADGIFFSLALALSYQATSSSFVQQRVVHFPKHWSCLGLLLAGSLLAHGQSVEVNPLNQTPPSPQSSSTSIKPYHSITAKQRLSWFVSSTVGPQTLTVGLS